MAYLLKFVNFQHEGDFSTAQTHYYLRLFRRLPNFSYKGRLHEQLFDEEINAPVQKNCKADNIVIYHYGYQEKIMKERGKQQRNIELLLKAIEDEPDNWFHRYNYGLALIFQEKKHEALEQFNLAEMYAEKAGYTNFDTSNYYYQAYIHLQIGEAEKTLEYCTKAIDKKDTYFDIYFLMGRAYKAMSQWQKALEHFKKACQHETSAEEPTSRVLDKGIPQWAAMFEIAVIYCEIYKDYEKGFFYLQRIQQHENNFPLILLKLFNIHLNCGRTGEAEKAALKFRNLFPSEVDFMPEYELVEHLFNNSAHNDISSLISSYLSNIKQPHPFFFKKVADRYFIEGKFMEALNFYETQFTIIDTVTPEESLLNNIVYCCDELKNFEKGIDYLEKGLVMYPDNSHFQGVLAKLYLSCNELEKARAITLKALHTEPENVSWRYNLAVTEYRLGNGREALLHFRTLISKNSFVPESLYLSSKILYDESMYGSSASLLKELINVDPLNMDAYELLEKNMRAQGNHQDADMAVENISKLKSLIQQMN